MVNCDEYSQQLLKKEYTQLLKNSIVEDRLIADEKEFSRTELFCIKIERGTTLNAIDFWQ